MQGLRRRGLQRLPTLLRPRPWLEPQYSIVLATVPGSGFRVPGWVPRSSFVPGSSGVQRVRVPWFRVPGSSQPPLGRPREREPGTWNPEPGTRERETWNEPGTWNPTWNPEPGARNRLNT